MAEIIRTRAVFYRRRKSKMDALVDAYQLGAVDTVAELSSLTTMADGDVVATLRYSTSHSYGDGSANRYRYASGDTTAVDGGFVLTSATGRWHAVDKSTARAKQFGAVGDGVTNDFDVLHNWVAASATATKLILDPGTYAVTIPTWDDTSAGWFEPDSDTEIVMTGATINVSTDGGKYIVFSFNGASRVVMRGGAIVGDRASAVEETGVALWVSNCDDVLIEHVTANDCKTDNIAIRGGASNCVVRHCSFDNAQRNNITVGDASDVLIENCIITGANGLDPEEGIDVEPNTSETADSITIRGCTVSGNTGGGIVARKGLGDGTTNVTVENCDVTGQLTSQQVYLESVDKFAVRNCHGTPGTAGTMALQRATNGTFENCRSSRLYFAGCSNVTVRDSYFDASALSLAAMQATALTSEGNANNRFLNNHFTGSTENGVDLENATHCTFENNVITDSTKHGLNVSFASNCSIVRNDVRHSGDASTYYNIVLSATYFCEVAHNRCRHSRYYAAEEVVTANTASNFTIRGIVNDSEDLWTGQRITIGGESRTIQSMVDRSVTVDTAFSVAPIVGDTYVIDDPTARTYRGLKISSNTFDNWIHHNDLRASGHNTNLQDDATTQNTTENNLS